jgi:uncharacterized protein YggE
MTRLSILLLLLGMAQASAHNNILQIDNRQIDVLGLANVVSVPDRFSFVVHLQQKGQVASKLNQLIGDKSKNIIQVLVDLGVPRKAIQSLRVQFNPWLEYTGKVHVQRGFMLSRSISIMLDNLAQYDQAIDAMLKIGVHRIDGFNYSSSQAAENQQQAIRDALVNARDKASDMAKVLGLNLGQVIAISEQLVSQSPKLYARMREVSADSSYEAGEMSTQAQVKVVFALAQPTLKE